MTKPEKLGVEVPALAPVPLELVSEADPLLDSAHPYISAPEEPDSGENESEILNTLSAIANIATSPKRQIKLAKMIGRGIFGNPLDHDFAPERIILENNGREHLFLVTEPREGNSTTAVNTVFFPGLTELGDTGSSSHMHTTYAEHHPDRRIITVATEGVSHTGALRFNKPGESRNMDLIAQDDLRLLPFLTQDGIVELTGTSRGTKSAMTLAELNMAANPGEMLNIQRLKLIASAIIACNIPNAENFLGKDIDEEKIRRDLSINFLLHVAPDLVRMAKDHPLDIVTCAPMVGAYALHPQKAPSRLKAIISDFRDVQKGVDWYSIKQIASSHQIAVLGGELDPLVQWQIPQWDAVTRLYPENIQHRVVEGKGHLLTADARGTVRHLSEMEDNWQNLSIPGVEAA